MGDNTVVHGGKLDMVDKMAAIGAFDLRTWDHDTCFATDTCKGILLTDEIMKAVGNVAYDLLVAAGIITMIVMVVGGIMYITSSGSPDKVAKAHGTISGGLIGALISISASQIVGFVMSQAGSSLGETIPKLMGTLYFLVGALSVIMIIYGGLSYMMASGDEGKTKKAKQTIVWACIGLAVALGAWAITQFVLTNVVA